MCIDILLYNFRCYFVAHRANKIAVLPELPAPKIALGEVKSKLKIRMTIPPRPKDGVSWSYSHEVSNPFLFFPESISHRLPFSHFSLGPRVFSSKCDAFSEGYSKI